MLNVNCIHIDKKWSCKCTNPDVPKKYLAGIKVCSEFNRGSCDKKVPNVRPTYAQGTFRILYDIK